jgi:allantoin racemase
VIGAGEASAALARLVARRFGVVTIVDSAVSELERMLRIGGFWGECVGITTIDMTFDRMGHDPEEAYARVGRAGRTLVDAGADAVLLGCMSFSASSRSPAASARRWAVFR